MTRTPQAVVCIGDPRPAALYFDQVIPIDPVWIVPFVSYDPKAKTVQLNGEGIRAVENALFQRNEQQREWTSHLTELFYEIFRLYDHLASLSPKKARKTLRKMYGQEPQSWYQLSDILAQIPDLTSEDFAAAAYLVDLALPHIGSLRNAIRVYADRCGLDHVALLLPSMFFADVRAKESDVTISLANVPLVDTSSATWEQILELRKSEEARSKLRRLHHFFRTSYEGRSRDFIEDDLAMRVEDYESASREFGFDLTTGTLSVMLDSKTLGATILATAGAALFSEPVVVAGAMVTGASVEIAKLALEVVTRRHAFHRFSQDHELAYLIEARRALSSPSRRDPNQDSFDLLIKDLLANLDE